METLAISIKQEVINTFGVNYIKKIVEQQIEFLYIDQIKKGIDKSLSELSLDNYSLLEKIL